MNPKFEMKAGETAAQYNARNNTAGVIAAAQPPTQGMKKDTPSGSSALLSKLEERLMSSSEGISSSSSEIEKAIAGAITSQEKSRVAGESRINSDYNAEKDYLMARGQDDITTFSQGRSGYATQMAALRNLTDTTDKTMRDLEVRRQDALMANDANAANQISTLQMKQLEFKQEKEQQFYNNIFQLTGLDLQQKSQDRAKQEFADRMAFDKEQRTFDRQDKMASLAAQAGVAYDANDTFESLSVKIAAIADEERKLKAQETLSRISKDAKDEDLNLVYDDILWSSIEGGGSAVAAAREVASQLRAAGQGLGREEYNKVLLRAKELEDEYKKTKSMKDAETGGNFFSKFFGGSTNNNPYYTPNNLLTKEKAGQLNELIDMKANADRVSNSNEVIESPETFADRFFRI